MKCAKCGSEMMRVQGTFFDYVWTCIKCAFERGHEEKVGGEKR